MFQHVAGSTVFTPQTTAEALEQQAVTEFLVHPDHRQVSAFFLGWVVLSSAQFVWSSPLLRDIIRKPRSTSTLSTDISATAHLEKGNVVAVNALTEPIHEGRLTLLVLLCLSFMLASLSNFLSLLTFGSDSGDVACAFVVASGIIASQAGRLVGLAILSLDLRRRKTARWESWVYWSALVVATALTFATTAIGVGRSISVTQVGASICYREHFLPTSLLTFLTDFIIEAYVVIRVIAFARPPRLGFWIIQDSNIVQAASLIILDLLLVVPSSTSTSILVQFIPFSLGSIIVLYAFHSIAPPSVSTEEVDRPSNPVENITEVSPNRPKLALVVPEPDIQIHEHPFSANSVQRSIPENIPEDVASAYDAIFRDSIIPTPDTHEGAVIHSYVRRPVSFQPVSGSFEQARALGITPPASNGPTGSRKILPSQVQVAEALTPKRQIGLAVPTRPHIVVDVTPASASYVHTPSDEAISASRSPGSTVLGSDIIRYTSQTTKDRMKRRPSAPLRSGPHSALSPSSTSRPTSFLLSPVHRNSVTSRHLSRSDTLTVVHERTTTRRTSLAPTFGSGGSPTSSILDESLWPKPPPPVARYVPSGPPSRTPIGALTAAPRLTLPRGPRPSPSNFVRPPPSRPPDQL
ncbi:hypothetical protein BV25DRAFT_1910584 [Artomyces pyxidatus]|uniref:Uncharacterized protein n=1 Tax=Artomyces pyxidatus TaxID=48021 RepID=A0ACB8TK81_9AGAM|nr:hypothetical protein BV25DRAFT_1910584 [Artomyces pyxidatus]